MKIVIIGGVAAGMSAASKAKRVDPSLDVVVFEQTDTVSYGACGLPYYVSGLNIDADKLLIRSPEEFAEQGIALHRRCRALSLDPAAKKVYMRNLDTGQEWAESYDRLMIATGAEAIRPASLPGIDSPGAHVLKSFADGLALRRAVKAGGRVVVVGGGAIGIEVAESLRATGIAVQIIEAASRILLPFDEEISRFLLSRLTERDVPVHLDEPVQEIWEENGRAAGVRTSRGEYPADIVILALGVRPATGFLKGSGIALAPNGAIEVDRFQRSNLPDVYAAGDCAMVYNRVENRNVYLALGTVANRCGRLAGENMAGGNASFPGCLGSAAISVCGWEAGRTGMGEATARELLGEVSTSFIQTDDLPAYYPGATPIWIKLICEAGTKRIVRGQAVGPKGAVLRVDALAAAITMDMTAPDLYMADFCYAPPFSRAWDPLNIAGGAVK